MSGIHLTHMHSGTVPAGVGTDLNLPSAANQIASKEVSFMTDLAFRGEHGSQAKFHLTPVAYIDFSPAKYAMWWQNFGPVCTLMLIHLNGSEASRILLFPMSNDTTSQFSRCGPRQTAQILNICK